MRRTPRCQHPEQFVPRPAPPARPPPARARLRAGALPPADCPSNEPSPVRTTDASATASARPMSVATSTEPGTSERPTRAGRTPSRLRRPPRGCPGRRASGRPDERGQPRRRPHRRCRALSAGRRQRPPRGPTSGLVTSLRTMTPPGGSGGRRERFGGSHGGEPRAPGAISSPAASVKRAPSAREKADSPVGRRARADAEHEP